MSRCIILASATVRHNKRVGANADCAFEFVFFDFMDFWFIAAWLTAQR